MEKNCTPIAIKSWNLNEDIGWNLIYNTIYIRSFSQLRAEAVCKILYKKGVDPERLVPHGYVGTMKKIQRPRTKEECYRNIRVEVLVMSWDYKKDPEYIKKHKKQ